MLNVELRLGKAQAVAAAGGAGRQRSSSAEASAQTHRGSLHAHQGKTLCLRTALGDDE